MVMPEMIPSLNVSISSFVITEPSSQTCAGECVRSVLFLKKALGARYLALKMREHELMEMTLPAQISRDDYVWQRDSRDLFLPKDLTEVFVVSGIVGTDKLVHRLGDMGTHLHDVMNKEHADPVVLGIPGI